MFVHFIFESCKTQQKTGFDGIINKVTAPEYKIKYICKCINLNIL